MVLTQEVVIIRLVQHRSNTMKGLMATIPDELRKGKPGFQPSQKDTTLVNLIGPHLYSMLSIISSTWQSLLWTQWKLNQSVLGLVHQ